MAAGHQRPRCTVLRCAVLLQSVVLLPDAGLHLSFFFAPELIVAKVKAYPHTEHNQPEFIKIAAIKKNIRDNQDLFGRGLSLSWVRPADIKALAFYSPQVRTLLLLQSQKLRKAQESGQENGEEAEAESEEEYEAESEGGE
jgi:hypothetical protein